MWSFVAFIWTCCFLEDTWAPLKRRHGLRLIREAVGCFRFDEQEVHMHSTKNVNETHSSQFLMETSLDLRIRRWREMGSHIPLFKKKKEKRKQDAGGSDSFEKQGKGNCVRWEVVHVWWGARIHLCVLKSKAYNKRNLYKCRFTLIMAAASLQVCKIKHTYCRYWRLLTLCLYAL